MQYARHKKFDYLQLTLLVKKKFLLLAFTTYTIDTSWLGNYLRHAKKISRKSEKLQRTFTV